MEDCKITVFTPTYNRAYIVENLYHSLQRQTYRCFEWIVVDDGSTDGTEDLFKTIISENNFFSIKYQKVQNGGKHRAINIGVSLAKGELFFIVDSDDYLTDDALEKVIEVEESIPLSEKKRFAGVCGKRGYTENKIIGTTFEGVFLDITSLEREKHNITGDQAEAFYTKILREFPFPEFDGERFLTEAVVWDRIANAGYKLRFFNEIIYICDYLPDGLTSAGTELFLKNPHGYGLWLSERAQFEGASFFDTIKIHYTFTCDLYELYDIKTISECIGIPSVSVYIYKIIHLLLNFGAEKN